VRALLLALLLAVTTASCSGDAAKPDARRTGTPTPTVSVKPEVPPAPARNACYRLDLDELTQPTNSSEPVPCGRSHTAQTIFVGRLKLVVDGHAVRVDSARVTEQLADTCPKRLASYVGGEQEDRDLSRFRVVWFGPTLEEADAGARWLRCDLVAFGTDDDLHEQKGRVPSGVLDGDGLDRYGLCGTAAPGAKGFRRVMCGLRHSWQAIAAIGLEGGAAYPGEDDVRDQGDSECSDLAREAQDFALTFTYGWEWPTREQWRAGQRFGYCWAPVGG